MDDDIQIIPFMGHLTGEAIRQMLQARFAKDYFLIANALAPEAFMRHAALSSTVAIVAERQKRG